MFLTATTGKDGATRVRTASGVGLGTPYAKAKKGLKHAKYAGTSRSGYFFFGKGTLGSVDTEISVAAGVVSNIVVERIDQVG